MPLTDDKTLDPRPNDTWQIDVDDKAVQTCLALIADNLTDKETRDTINETVLTAVEEEFSVDEPQPPRLVQSKMLYQAWWKAMSRVKCYDFSLHGTGAEESEEAVVSQGVATVLDRMGFLRTFLGKGGTMPTALGIGDAFFLLTTDEERFPLKVVPIPNNQVYLDSTATGMRTGTRPITKIAVIVEYKLGEFNRLYPDSADKVGVGEIPRKRLGLKNIDQKYIQTINKKGKDYIEVCHYFDVSNMAYVVFAGAGCTILTKKLDKEYPFKFKDDSTNKSEPYVPVFHFLGLQSFQGFYNWGIFQAIYDRAITNRRLINKTMAHVDENTDPVTFVSVPFGKGGDVMAQIDEAVGIRAAGGRPFIPLERGMGDTGGVSSSSMYVPSNISEVDYLIQRGDLEVKRMGFHLDEPEQAGTTATEILSEEENATMRVRQIMEDNAPEFEKFLQVILSLIPQTVSKNSKIPLNLTTSIKITTANGEERVRAEGATLGLLSSLLSEKHYFAKVNARSGYIAPKMLMAQTARVLNMAPQGSRAYGKAIEQYAQQNDKDLTAEDFQVPAQAPMGGEVNAEGMPIPADTERMGINPRLKEQLPVI